MEPRFKVSSERLEKQGMDLAIPGLIVLPVTHSLLLSSHQVCDSELLCGINVRYNCIKISYKVL